MLLLPLSRQKQEALQAFPLVLLLRLLRHLPLSPQSASETENANATEIASACELLPLRPRFQHT